VNVELLHLYLSPGHNFLGHHGGPPGEHPIVGVEELKCVAGRGIEGDRYFDFKPDHKGQITFFADEVYQELCDQFGVRDKTAAVFRRNVITRGADLHAWIGVAFELQGIRFLGVEHCKPCYWMDQAFAPGADAALQAGRGGLRAKILTSGTLCLTSQQPCVA
jgi:MOSC domain-containing protein YiiM